MKTKSFLLLLFFAFTTIVCLNGCSATYKGETLEEAVKDVCRKDYGVEDVQVKVIGKTLGVYLPLERLFSSNLEAFNSEDPEASFEDLFKFNEEAMERVEDVLFSISRVILSTNRQIDFYVLKAVETKSSGIELVLTGYVQDMKYVRFWNISVNEYRKRFLQDLSINRTVIWRRVVRDFFEHVGQFNLIDLISYYFVEDIELKDISPFFYSQLVESEYKKELRYDIKELKTKPISEREVLVYVRLREFFEPRDANDTNEFLFKNGVEHEYLFVIQAGKTAYKIRQVIPFYYVDENKMLRKLDFPEELKVYNNIDTWDSEFDLEEVFMGSFISRQMTKRAQGMIMQDPEVMSLFFSAKVDFGFIESNDVEGASPQFFVEVELADKDGAVIEYAQAENNVKKNIYLLLQKVFDEFCVVLNGYEFNEFESIELLLSPISQPISISQNEINNYRNTVVDKRDISSLIDF